MGKKYFTGLNAIKEQFESHQNMPLTSNPNVIMQEVDLYQTSYNYSNIEDIEDRNKLLQYEFTVSNSLTQINKHLRDVCEKLFFAQNILSNYDKNQGMFVEWYESIGLQKNFVYRCIDRYQLFLDTKKEIYLTEKVSIRSIQLVKSLPEMVKITVAEQMEGNNLISSTQLAKYINDHFPRVGNDAENLLNERIITKDYKMVQDRKALKININGKFSTKDIQSLATLINEFLNNKNK